MTKGDLRARPVFHHQREAIEAHLTVAFAALTVALACRTPPAPASRRSSRPCARTLSDHRDQRSAPHPRPRPHQRRPRHPQAARIRSLSDWHESGQAHLTIVFAALAVSREAPSTHRAEHQQDSQGPPAPALSHRHHRRPAGDRPAPHPRRGPNPPQCPRLEWSLNRYNSGQTMTSAFTAPKNSRSTWI